MSNEDLLISPTTNSARLQLGEVWRHRDLLRYLTIRDIQIVYANTSIGLLWVVLQPLATALVLTLVFAILVRVPTGGIPYPLVILSAYPFFLYFSNVVTRSANSMSANAHLMTKVYFPRLIIVLVPLLAGLIDLLILLAVVLLAAPFFGKPPAVTWLAMVLPIVLVVLLALGLGLWLSLLTVYVKDIRHALPLMLQIVLYLTPVIYPIALVPAGWRWFYDLNPMVGIVETARWALLGTTDLPVYALTASGVLISLILVGGFFFFRVLEDATADLI